MTPILKLCLDLFLLFFVILGLKGAGDIMAQGFHEAIHVGFQLAASPEWQAQRAGFIAVFKIIYIAPIVRWRLVRAFSFQQFLDHRGFACTRRTERKNVVAWTCDLNTKRCGADRAFLDFLASGPGNAAFGACGRTGSR